MPKSSQIAEGEVRPIPQPDKIVSRMAPPGQGQGDNPEAVTPAMPDLPPSEMFKKMSAELREASQRRRQEPAKEPAKEPKPKEPAAKPPAPAAKPEEPKPPADAPEPPHHDEDVPSVIKSPKAADEFRRLKSTLSEQIKAKQDEILGLKKQLDDEKTKVAQVKVEPSELEKQLQVLKAERDGLASQLEEVALERSPSFRKKYESRFAAAVEQAKASAGEHAEKIEMLASMSPKDRKVALNAILEDLETSDQLSLVSALNSFDTARREREMELRDHHQVAQARMEEELVQQKRQQEVLEAKREYVTKEVLKAARSFEAFTPVDGDDEHNRMVQEYERDVASFIAGKVDDAAAAFLPVLAAEGQFLKQRRVPALEAKIKELEGTITKLSGSSASVKEGSGSKDDKAATGRAEKAKGFIDAFREVYSGPKLHNLG